MKSMETNGLYFQNPEQSLSRLPKSGNSLWNAKICMQKQRGKKAKKEILEDAEELLKELRFENPQRVLKSYPFELSGGMCQRVAIALAIMNQPPFLLADEPTSALDVASQDMTIETLLALRKKTDLSILLVTHNMEVARRLADEIGVMYQGRIIESGLPEEIWNDPKEDYTKKLIAAIPQPVKLVLDEG